MSLWVSHQQEGDRTDPLTHISTWVTPSDSVCVVGLEVSEAATQAGLQGGLRRRPGCGQSRATGTELPEQNSIREGWPRAHAQVQVGAGTLAALGPGPGRSAASCPTIQEGTEAQIEGLF